MNAVMFPYTAAARLRPASALTSKPRRNYVLALKRAALRCLKNDMMNIDEHILLDLRIYGKSVDESEPKEQVQGQHHALQGC